ncbi:hypothetical protein CUMW_019110, partial [Citrus unshiu]
VGLKSLVYAVILVAAMATLTADAQGGVIGTLLGLIHNEGTLYCTVNGNIGDLGQATPVFPNAKVQLQCGGNVNSTAVTSESGSFSIVLDPVQIVVSSLLNDCCLVLKTPLATRNSNPPSAGDLFSPLTIVGNTLLGILLKPVGFQSMPQSLTNHVSDKALLEVLNNTPPQKKNATASSFVI